MTTPKELVLKMRIRQWTKKVKKRTLQRREEAEVLWRRADILREDNE